MGALSVWGEVGWVEASWRRNSGCWPNIKRLWSALCGVRSTQEEERVSVYMFVRSFEFPGESI